MSRGEGEEWKASGEGAGGEKEELIQRTHPSGGGGGGGGIERERSIEDGVWRTKIDFVIGADFFVVDISSWAHPRGPNSQVHVTVSVFGEC